MDKKYNLYHVVMIMFRYAPIVSIVSVIDKIILALIPVALIYATNMVVSAAMLYEDNQVLLFNELLAPVILMLVLISLQVIEKLFSNLIRSWGIMQLKIKYSLQMVEHVAKLEYKHIENKEIWNQISRVVTEPEEEIITGFFAILNFCSIVITIVSLSTVLASQTIWISAVVVLLCGVMLFVSYINGKKNYNTFVMTSELTRRADYLSEVLVSRNNIEERTLFDYTNHINGQYEENYETARKMQISQTINEFTNKNLASLFTVIIAFLVTIFFLKQVQDQLLEVGMYIGIITALISLYTIINGMLSEVFFDIIKCIKFLKDMELFFGLSLIPQSIDIPNKENVTEFNKIEFKGVSFKYPGTDRLILNNVSFTLEKGYKYAFVGVNGAGKSTLVKLILKMYDDYTGTILLNDKDLRSYSLSTVKAIFGVMFQDFAKYNISVADSICLGRIEAPDKVNVLEELNKVDIDDIVNNLPNRADTKLGKIYEENVDLSFGQWQRLAIGRLLAGDRSLYILDEPTASLDPVMESKVYELFSDVSKGKSTILISHRLGSVALADSILVLEDGHIINTGTHKELMKSCSLYCKMYKEQRGWYE